MNILYPHVLFSLLYNNFYAEWVKRLCGGDCENISTFWQSQTAHPAYNTHPMHKHPSKHDFKKKGIAVAMHGDGVTVTGVGKKQQTHMDCMSWTSLLATGLPILLSNFINLLFVSIVRGARRSYLRRGHANCLLVYVLGIHWNLARPRPFGQVV